MVSFHYSLLLTCYRSLKMHYIRCSKQERCKKQQEKSWKYVTILLRLYTTSKTRGRNLVLLNDFLIYLWIVCLSNSEWTIRLNILFLTLPLLCLLEKIYSFVRSYVILAHEFRSVLPVRINTLSLLMKNLLYKKKWLVDSFYSI